MASPLPLLTDKLRNDVVIYDLLISDRALGVIVEVTQFQRHPQSIIFPSPSQSLE